MIMAVRQSRLKDLLARKGMSDLETLSAELSVSQSTIRRDIEQLESAGYVQRTHGGVIWIGEANAKAIATATRPYAFDHRMSYQVEAKRQIARAAKKLISPGDTILVDGGTTTFYLAQELVGEPLQLVTNSLPIANLFLNDENVDLVVLGGQLHPRNGVLLGPIAENMLGNIHTKTLFFSVAGVFGGNLYNQNMLLVQAERRMMEQAQQVVLMADSGKFVQQALARLCGLEEVDIVVSDSGLSSERQDEIRAAGCELIIAG